MKHNYEKRGTDRFLGNLPGVETVPQSIAFGEGCGQHEFGRPEFRQEESIATLELRFL